ncbi:hypothetical protein PFICI_08685 [Pestalotiopsis fici W106-1]|uniref:Uncharacterized protein n=1 Tax=Pestalotiopsis fici (strain W106-1 / CGMCC3.15140) TaxID=1229662 RepID=W3X0E7_PESFW|nr:uncharacterized protein PFICI_08685 [Pestalotiopsis fici W106-1]ETS78832.1 hypothetical protein PFICI_08685 [Pestalotiopsis fici W106-1]
MNISLQTPTPAVSMTDRYVSTSETTFTVHCHDSTFRKVTVFDSSEQVLFRVEGSAIGTSWSWRRKVLDSSGRALFDFRHHKFDNKNGWVVESPDGQKLCSLEHAAFLKKGHAAITAIVRTTAGEDVRVEMMPMDHSALTTTVGVDGCPFAAITKIEDNDVTLRGGKDRSVWSVQAASGVDLSLLLAMVLCRAEMGHVWKN